MKTMTVVCLDCGYERKVRIYDREDAEKGKFNLRRPICDQCGSSNVKIYD